MKKILFAMFCALSMVCFFSCGPEDSVTYELKPREELPVKEDGSFTKIFLAGTIDMGNSVDWQAQLKEYFSGKEGRYILYNPRRGSWNGGAGGEMEYQVNWELESDNSAGNGTACPFRKTLCGMRTVFLPV